MCDEIDMWLIQFNKSLFSICFKLIMKCEVFHITIWWQIYGNRESKSKVTLHEWIEEISAIKAEFDTWEGKRVEQSAGIVLLRYISEQLKGRK